MTTTRHPKPATTPPASDALLPATVEDSPTVPQVVDNGEAHAIAHAVSSAPEIGNWDDLDLDPDGGILPLLPINRKVGQSDSGILLDNERVLELDMIWAARSTSRAHFPARYDVDPNSRPDCWSTSGTEPDPNVPAKRAEGCATCPWSFEQTGGKDGPDGSPGCSKNLEALVYLEEGGMHRVARIRFNGIAYKPARAYWDSFRWGRPKKYALQFLTRMRLVATKTDHGEFLIPEFERAGMLKAEEAVAIGSDARALMGSFQALVADEVIEGVAREADGGDPFADQAPLAADGAAVDPETGEIARPIVNQPEDWSAGEEPF